MSLVRTKEVLSKYYRKWIKQMDANDKLKWGQIFFHVTVQKMKFLIKDFSSKCDQIQVYVISWCSGEVFITHHYCITSFQGIRI